MNPFNDSLDGFRGKRVRVHSGDVVREGLVERVHHDARHVVLRGAVEVPSGEDLGRAFVAHADAMEVVDPERRVESLRLAAIDPSPYHNREFDAAANADYIQQVASDGWVGSYPVVREADGRYELVAGHKRCWVAEQAGLRKHPFELVDIDDWQATKRYLVDHMPDLEADQAATVRERVRDDWGDRASELPFIDGENAVDEDETDERVSQESTVQSDGDDEETDDVDEHEGEDDDQDIDLDKLTDLQREVVDALPEDGEQTASELQNTTGEGQGIYNRISALQRDGFIESRDDPDDARRSLYSVSETIEEQVVDDTAETTVSPFDELSDCRKQIVRIIGGAGEGEPQQLRQVVDGDLNRNLYHLFNDGIVDRRDHPEDVHRTIYELTDEALERYADVEFATDIELPAPEEVDWDPPETRSDVEAAIDDADDLEGIAAELDVSVEKTLRLLGYYDLDHHILGKGNVVEFDEVEAALEEVEL